MQDKIELYKTRDGKIQVEVKFEGDTAWLSQKMMAELFNVNVPAISKHLKNIFESGELEQKEVISILETTTQHGAIEGKTQTRKSNFYNLDAIIAIGYRINSIRGTRFRQWATQRLRDYLVEGYAINELRLKQKQQEVKYLKTGIRILNRAIEEQVLNIDSDILKVFAKGLELLDEYDHDKLDKKGKSKRKGIYPEKEDYLNIIRSMKTDYSSGVFAQMKDDSFESSINQIRQSFDGKDLYPTVEEKAAYLLYFIVKNHSFTDGNKRIAAACFLHFLHKNNHLFLKNNLPMISNETLAALTLFIASSKSEEMETVVKFIISILNRGKN
ncbi:MAG: virulence protein RhuM/Fic/DOC family protein [Candidatus Marinimicrobia bacterium]|nr:virulence protein RhuM/Fic/DOC family protein [Candidatus Neomarinimicrobiota bacterium]